jgi:uncharacterized membrane protein
MRRFVKATDRGLIRLNLLRLLFVSFLPFTTAIAATHLFPSFLPFADHAVSALRAWPLTTRPRWNCGALPGSARRRCCFR